MSIHYHPSKANIVNDVLSRLSMSSTTDKEEEKKELDKEVHRISCLIVHLVDYKEDGIIIQNEDDSSLIVEVKQKYDQDPIQLQLKEYVHRQKVMVFVNKGDGVSIYQDRLSFAKANELRERIMVETITLKYLSIQVLLRCIIS